MPWDTPRRCGIGSALYRKMLEMLREQGFKSVYGVIVESNDPSIALHRSLGFYEAAHFEHMGYKHGIWHGIVWMKKDLGVFDSDLLPQHHLQNTRLEGQCYRRR